MSSFWNTSDGEDISQTASGEFDAGGGAIELIPAGAQVLAAIDEAKWDKDQQHNRFVSLRWTVLAPEELKNRKVFQKLWVDDLDPSVLSTKGQEKAIAKRDKAKRMLAAIDTNAGGKLMRGGMPTDESLTMCLTNKPMVVRVEVWEQKDRMTGDMIRGNWIGAVAPRIAPSELPPVPAAKVEARTGGGGGGSSRREVDDEIPF